jgi:hypothetical protein
MGATPGGEVSGRVAGDVDGVVGTELAARHEVGCDRLLKQETGVRLIGGATAHSDPGESVLAAGIRAHGTGGDVLMRH